MNTDRRRQVWWMGLGLSTTIISVAAVFVLLNSSIIASALLGPETSRGALYVVLVMARVIFAVPDRIQQTLFRVKKWSIPFVIILCLRLILNVSINLVLLNFGWGILGILTGNLITAVVIALVRIPTMLVVFGLPESLDLGLCKRIMLFAWPLAISNFLALGMHQCDRYILRLNTDMTEIGLYSVGYGIAQAAAGLIMAAFASVFRVTAYEASSEEQADHFYARVFEFFVYGMTTAMLIISIFSKPLVAIMASPSFASASEIVPIICLAYLIFSVHDQFRLPALLSGRTTHLLPVSVIALIINISSNFLLIPIFGIHGSAWATVITFLVYSTLTLFVCRQMQKIPYQLGRSLLTVGSAFVAFVLFSRFSAETTVLTQILIGLGVLTAWMLIIAMINYRHIRQAIGHLPFWKSLRPKASFHKRVI